EVRAPMTLAQLLDAYKKERATFTVTLLPIRVQDYLAKVGEPDELQKEQFFNKAKGDPFDPGSDKVGLEIPPRSKFEFLIADAQSPAYRDRARLITRLKQTDPLAVEILRSQSLTADVGQHIAKFLNASHTLFQPPLANELRQMALAVKAQDNLEKNYKTEIIESSRANVNRYRAAAPFSDRDVTA